MENCENSYLELIEEKIELGRSLIEKLERDFIEVEGGVKTKRNIEKEIKFLEKVRNSFVKVDLWQFLMLSFPAQRQISKWLR